jgi:hypothetical protein
MQEAELPHKSVTVTVTVFRFKTTQRTGGGL